MNINELIDRLTAIRDEYRDMPVLDTDAHPIIGVTVESTVHELRCFLEAEF